MAEDHHQRHLRIAAARASITKDGAIIENEYGVAKMNPACVLEKAARDGFFAAMRLQVAQTHFARRLLGSPSTSRRPVLVWPSASIVVRLTEWRGMLRRMNAVIHVGHTSSLVRGRLPQKMHAFGRRASGAWRGIFSCFPPASPRSDGFKVSPSYLISH